MQTDAVVTSISNVGCFVLSGGKVEPRELVRLEITFPDQTQIFPWAEVVEEAGDIGFAVNFTAMTDEETEQLSAFMKQVLAARGRR